MLDTAAAALAEPPRTARPRRFLMCRPTYFDVDYSINPWMDPSERVDNGLACAQWESLRDLYGRLGHTVELIDPLPGLPDMVFAANGAVVIDGRVLVSRFRHAERAAESAAYAAWFRAHGYERVECAESIAEGEGDYLVTRDWLLAGTGFRSDKSSHTEANKLFGHPVVGLTLVDPHYYHLDTALAVLDEETIMYYPAAFSRDSRATLEELFPDAILATDADAAVFGLNAVSDGLHVVLPPAATGLADRLREAGFEPIGLDLSEFLKSGGSIKCCTLELRDA